MKEQPEFDFDFCGVCGDAPYLPNHRCSEADLKTIDNAHAEALRDSTYNTPVYHIAASSQNYDR